MINWNYFPRSKKCPEHLRQVVGVFQQAMPQIDGDLHPNLPSNVVLSHVAEGLGLLGYVVELGKGRADKVSVPVLFGQNGAVVKSFDADAWHHELRTVLEVEAGRAVANNQFLKDLFQACMMDEVEHLVIAVRNLYDKSNGKDFQTVSTFMETLYASGRLTLPLRGILIIGY